MKRFARALLVAFTIASFQSTASAAPPVKPAATAGVKSLGDTLTGPAKGDYDAGRLLVVDGDFAGARIKFQAAYDVSKDPRLLFNVAAAEKQLRHYAKAIELLKKYAADASPLVTAKDKAEAAEFIRTLEPFTVAVTFDVSEPDAEIEVDDASVGKTPLAAPIVIDIGQHRVRAHKETFRDFTTSVSVGGSATQSVLVKLEKEVHEGKLAITIPAGATVTIDGQLVPPNPAEKSKDVLEVKLLSGGHTLRVTAPGMRTYEREVVVKDNETRVVEVAMEFEAEPSKPRLRVTVGCGDARPRGVDDGLAVYADGSPVALGATGGSQTWDEGESRNVIQHVEYPLAAGAHRVRVTVPGCTSLETAVSVDQASGASIAGALESNGSVLWRGPAWDPIGYRVGLSLWLPSALIGREGNDRDVTNRSGQKYKVKTSYTSSPFDFAGPMLTAGWTSRFVVAYADFGVAWGSASLDKIEVRAANGGEVDASNVDQQKKVTTNWFVAQARAGLRLPLNVVAISGGPAVGVQAPFSDVDGAVPLGFLGGWLGIDVHPLCDVSASLDGVFHGASDQTLIGGQAVYLQMMLGVAFQPNSVCRRERATKFGLFEKK